MTNYTLQMKLAKKAGITKVRDEDTDWAYEYSYHLGAVENPFPFEIFKAKYILLQSYYGMDPKGANRGLDAPIDRLCRELGY